MKQNICNKYNCKGHLANVKIQSRLVVKPKIIQSLSACKNQSINPFDSSNHMQDAPDFRVPYDLKGLTPF